jgi:hypothetical protein
VSDYLAPDAAAGLKVSAGKVASRKRGADAGDTGAAAAGGGSDRKPKKNMKQVL